MLRVGLRALGVAALVGGPYSAWSTRCDTTRHVVRLGVPRPIRVAGISDLHLDQDRAKYERLVDAVNAERPDVLVVVGDTIDCRKGRAPEDLVPLIRSIEAPLGKFAALGNWDRDSFEDIGDLRRLFEQAGTQLLVNESVEVAGIRVVGVDDMVTGEPDIGVVERGIARGPTLLLTHCPEFFDRTAGTVARPVTNPLFAVAGHTHGGQIAPLGVALFTPKCSGRYVDGWYGDRDRSLYVMRGVGYSGPHVRIGARPELAVFDLV